MVEEEAMAEGEGEGEDVVGAGVDMETIKVFASKTYFYLLMKLL